MLLLSNSLSCFGLQRCSRAKLASLVCADQHDCERSLHGIGQYAASVGGLRSPDWGLYTWAYFGEKSRMLSNMLMQSHKHNSQLETQASDSRRLTRNRRAHVFQHCALRHRLIIPDQRYLGVGTNAGQHQQINQACLPSTTDIHKPGNWKFNKTEC